ncbi:acyl-CoA thioesterase [Robbsia andropogonis]|uniref:acyl-CoA thioesterase n=1 Tax=Robbsia andropogonis TaxID=28092 RepID=UPI0020A20C39|nr:acyl-CoA thioesterase [Robbsia andropogonis]MCP1121257.1 acyl-CoA thioesterase [Robbsia andropogonis]MCP1131050.1 acyl-CoA thioesterase [Robbsia andropogonis]
MNEAFKSEYKVREYEIDAGGGVPHAVFLNYYQQARHELLLALKFPFQDLKEAGIGFVVIRIETDYLQSLFPDEDFVIYTKMSRPSKLRFRFDQTMHRKGDETLVSTSVNIGTIVDSKNRPVLPPMLESCLTSYPVIKAN